MNIILDRPIIQNNDVVQTRLDNAGLRLGSTHVIKYKGKFYASGDYTHCGDNITHNIHKMINTMLERKWAYYGKAYDSDFYTAKRVTAKDFEDMKRVHNLKEVVL